uniref:Uncharacterized protein n=1 Tax=Anopheles arabiensis TaxID=7173 RepID=A0A182IF93_ANOAR
HDGYVLHAGSSTVHCSKRGDLCAASCFLPAAVVSHWRCSKIAASILLRNVPDDHSSPIRSELIVAATGEHEHTHTNAVLFLRKPKKIPFELFRVKKNKMMLY